MNIIPMIIELLGKQNEVLEEVEAITDKILCEQAEELTGLVEERGKLLEESLLLKEEIAKAAADNHDVLNVLRCSCDISNLSDEQTMVFDGLMRARATASRISRMDSEIYSRIEREKSSILEHLETLNRSGNSVAESYKRAVQTGFPENRFDGENNMTV